MGPKHTNLRATLGSRPGDKLPDKAPRTGCFLRSAPPTAVLTFGTDYIGLVVHSRLATDEATSPVGCLP
jgi:hypothetical protein